MLFFTKLTSLPIDMIFYVWRDWFEDFKSLKKGKGIYSLNTLPDWIFFICLSLSKALFKFLEKTLLDRHTALCLHRGIIGGCDSGRL